MTPRPNQRGPGDCYRPNDYKQSCGNTARALHNRAKRYGVQLRRVHPAELENWPNGVRFFETIAQAITNAHETEQIRDLLRCIKQQHKGARGVILTRADARTLKRAVADLQAKPG